MRSIQFKSLSSFLEEQLAITRTLCTIVLLYTMSLTLVWEQTSDAERVLQLMSLFQGDKEKLFAELNAAGSGELTIDIM